VVGVVVVVVVVVVIIVILSRRRRALAPYSCKLNVLRLQNIYKSMLFQLRQSPNFFNLNRVTNVAHTLLVVNHKISMPCL